MPQRQRPRLKRNLITCDWCGSTALKLYPSRESVRQQLSPYHFCSSTCQRDHWEARRKAGWVAMPYPCRQCGATITPQQAPGRRRDYCSAACKQKAARERLRRNPAGAVVAARQRFQEAWRQAVKAMNQWVEFDAHGATVEGAYRHARLVINTEGVPHEAKIEAVALIPKAIRGLDGPQYVGEPSRSRAAGGEWQEWWKWWLEGGRQLWRLYDDHLAAARAATAELRKRERVAARRAETARLRRAAARDPVEDSTGSVGFSPADLELRPG